jgi:hypothetical protein
VLCNQDILVLDSQKQIVVGVLGTQLKGEVDMLAKLQPHLMSTRCAAGGNVGSGGDVAIEVMLSLPTLVTTT